jgi:hypothetical protein
VARQSLVLAVALRQLAAVLGASRFARFAIRTTLVAGLHPSPRPALLAVSDVLAVGRGNRSAVAKGLWADPRAA